MPSLNALSGFRFIPSVNSTSDRKNNKRAKYADNKPQRAGRTPARQEKTKTSEFSISHRYYPLAACIDKFCGDRRLSLQW